MRFQWLKRPSLLWMSAKNIKRVRDRIIGLYLEPGTFVEYEGMRLYGGAIPCFERVIGCTTVGFRTQRAYFKYTKDKPPQWDFQYAGEGKEWSKVKTYPFSAYDVQWAAQLVKRWHRNFPFKPTDNFLRDIETIDPRED